MQTSLTKIATGDVQTFENSLATIGRSFLTAKAPALFKHEIGFQVLDQDEDNSKAVGVFGFRIGKRLLYVPIFYRDGVIKGTEQLRDPGRKVTVPLSDNWVNKFLSEFTDEPPELRSRSATRDTSQPSLWQLKYPPTKYAAAQDWQAAVKDIKADLAVRITRTSPPAALDVDLIKVASSHPSLFAELGRWAALYPWFSDALAKFHGKEKIASALAALEGKPEPGPNLFASVAHPDIVPVKRAASKLTIVRASQTSLHHINAPGDEPLYDPKEWEDLRKQKNIYHDLRGPQEQSEVTWLGGVIPEGDVMHNPSATGMYEVLTEGHEFTPCVVLMPLVGWGPSIGRCLVYRPKDDAWIYTHPNAVWVRGEADHKAFSDWAEKLPTVDDETWGVPEGRYAAIAKISENNMGGDGYDATVPFQHWGDGEASPLCPPNWDRPFWAAFNPWEDRPDLHAGSRRDHAPKCVEVFDEASRPVLSGHQLYLPLGCHLLKLDGPKLRPGTGTDPERVIMARRLRHNDAPLKMRKSASGFVVYDHRGKEITPRLIATASDTEAHLVAHHGLKVAQARELVERTAKEKTLEACVKYATSYTRGLADDSPVAPTLPFDQLPAPASFADDIIPTETGTGAAIPIDDMLMQPGAYDRYRPYPQEYGIMGDVPGIGNGSEPAPRDPGRNDLEAVSAAASGGRRELFDTAALAALVKHKRLATLTDECRKRLGKAVSDLGDMLAHLHWNTEEWAEQYGETEVGPLEDQIQSQFEGLGELVLTLQEKAVGDGLDPGILPTLRPNDGSETMA